MSRLRIGIFGCTGSIGRNAIEIATANHDRVEITALAAGSNEGELLRLGKELGVTRLALGHGTNGVPSGPDALRALAASDAVDLVVNAVVGGAGLPVTLGALDAGHDIALANKESLVMAGSMVMKSAAARGVAIRPIDSEHAALANCLRGRSAQEVRNVYLTASGGPFRGRAAGSFDDVTVEEALNHPTWKMGPKITIDSATLMNKGLEIIEAHHLFGIPPERIEVVVHPQSIIHAMVEHMDGSFIAELAPPDMRIPIQRAILDEGKFSAPLKPTALSALTFEPLDHAAFPLPGLARLALERGDGASAVLNAANEVAVRAFLDKNLRFRGISDIIRRSFDAWPGRAMEKESDVYEADAWGRKFATAMVAKNG